MHHRILERANRMQRIHPPRLARVSLPPAEPDARVLDRLLDAELAAELVALEHAEDELGAGDAGGGEAVAETGGVGEGSGDGAVGVLETVAGLAVGDAGAAERFQAWREEGLVFGDL